MRAVYAMSVYAGGILYNNIRIVGVELLMTGLFVTYLRVGNTADIWYTIIKLQGSSAIFTL